jgi:uracil-DNA glycosylase
VDQSSGPDYRKSLAVLKNDWQDCKECELGVQREAKGGPFIFGEGFPRGIMFIGAGPGKDEEKNGRPFIGKGGQILRHIIAKLNIERHYVTNVVTCRSCGQAYDTEGNPRYRRDYKTKNLVPWIQDGPPTPAQVAACMPRLHEEIYLVDPILIVSLGAEASKALSRKAISISRDSGTMMTITIPGAGFQPVLTEKRRLWARKVRGQLVTPVAQTEVKYLMMPLIHPAFALRNSSDARWKNPVQLFIEGMKQAAQIYYRYMLEVHGDRPNIGIVTEDDVLEAMQE